MAFPVNPGSLHAGKLVLLVLLAVLSWGGAPVAAQEEDCECDYTQRREVWIDRVEASGDLVFTNSGVNKDLFLNGAMAQAAVGGPLRLGIDYFPDPTDKEWVLDWKLGGGAQDFAGESDVDLVQTGVGDFRLTEARIYFGTAGLGLRGYKAIQDGFTLSSRLGVNFLAGEAQGRFQTIANNPALPQINIAAPDTSDLLWGGNVEWKVGIIGPRGWGIYGGCTYGAYRTEAFTGYDQGSTFISAGITVEKTFGWQWRGCECKDCKSPAHDW